MNQFAKSAFTSMFLNALDHRDPAVFIDQLTGEDCVTAHNILRRVDEALKDHWQANGSPDGEGFDETRIALTTKPAD